MSNAVAIIANGSIESYEETKHLVKSYTDVIAVDGGLLHCKKMEIEPILVIGDFDSTSLDLLSHFAHIPQLKFSKDKDESDLELAIQEAIARGYKEFHLFGALGKRVDHLLYTLFLLTRFPNCQIISENQRIFSLKKENKIKTYPGQTVSLIPLNEVKGVYTKGLKWELKNTNLDKYLISLSNEALSDEFSVNIDSGDLILILNT
jgi:thiamine pyrophosphokinase